MKKDDSTKIKDKRKITKDMIVSEVLDLDDRLQYVLLGFGLSCFGCPLSKLETLEDASKTHDLDLEVLLEQLNEMHESPKED